MKKEIENGIKNTLLITGGALAHRSIVKALDKLIAKKKPELANKLVYKYGKSGVFALLGALGPIFLKGKQKELATSVGIGLAGDAILSLINQVSKGRLGGDEEMASLDWEDHGGQDYYAPPVAAYLPASNSDSQYLSQPQVRDEDFNI